MLADYLFQKIHKQNRTNNQLSCTMSQHKLFTRSTIIFYTIQATQYLLPILLVPYLLTHIGTANYGSIIFSQSIAQYLTIICDYGFSYSATRDAARLKAASADLSLFYTTIQHTRWTLLFISLPVFIYIIYLIPSMQEDWLLYAIAVLTPITGIILPQWYLQGIEKLEYLMISQVSGKIVCFTCCIIFIDTPDDKTLSALFLSGPGFLTAIIIRWRLQSRQAFPPRNSTGINSIITRLRTGWQLFKGKIAIELYTTSNSVIIGFVTTPTEVAYFYVAERIVRGIQTLSQPIVQGHYPAVSAMTIISPSQALNAVRYLFIRIFPATAIVSIILIIKPDPIIAFFYSSLPENAVLTFRCLVPILPIITISNIYGNLILLPFGHERQFSRILIIAGCTGPILITIFSTMHGAPGAGVAIVITESIVSLMMLVTAHSLTLNPFSSDNRPGQS